MTQCPETHGKCKHHNPSPYGLYRFYGFHTEARCRKEKGHKKQHKCGCCRMKWIDGEVVCVTFEESETYSQSLVLLSPYGSRQPGSE